MVVLRTKVAGLHVDPKWLDLLSIWFKLGFNFELIVFDFVLVVMFRNN
jgi:hypothetical protein